MKTKNTPTGLVLFLTIGIITIVSFSFGCTDQGEDSSKPVENISLQTESVTNTSEIVSNTSEYIANVSESVVNSSEPAVNTPKQSEPVESVSSKSGSSKDVSSQSESSGDVSPRLEPVSANSVTSIKWLWGGYKHFDSYTSVPNPEHYTLAFFPNGKCSITAECSSGNGSYVLKENNLTIDSTAITTMACGPDSMDPEYLGLLAGVNSAIIEDGQLIMYSSEGDIMYFTKGGQSKE
jgi:heat shock protein HslJ